MHTPQGVWAAICIQDTSRISQHLCVHLFSILRQSRHKSSERDRESQTWCPTSQSNFTAMLHKAKNEWQVLCVQDTSRVAQSLCVLFFLHFTSANPDYESQCRHLLDPLAMEKSNVASNRHDCARRPTMRRKAAAVLCVQDTSRTAKRQHRVYFGEFGQRTTACAGKRDFEPEISNLSHEYQMRLCLKDIFVALQQLRKPCHPTAKRRHASHDNLGNLL